MGKKKKKDSVLDIESANFTNAAARTESLAAAFASSSEYRETCRVSARKYAERNCSDPFAYGRAMLAFKHGHATAKDVALDSLH